MGGDQEDLWDFGTIRNAARAGTVGRAQQNPIQVSGPPLTWENNGTSHSVSSGSTTRRGSGSSGSSMKSSTTSKGDLPPLPPSASSTPNKYSDHQATLRNAPGESAAPKHNSIQREPSDEDEDYGEQYEDAYTSHIQEGRGQVVLEDELPDTTMLDSVILPAIASVSIYNLPAFQTDAYPCPALSPCVNTRRPRCP